MKEETAFALATQQSYATGKAPKGFGTTEGKREAEQKYDEPQRDYEQKANPSSKAKTSGISLVLLKGFSEELQKIAAVIKPSGVPEITKHVVPSKKTPTYTKVNKEPDPPAPVTDSLSSAKTMQPPPVTMAG